MTKPSDGVRPFNEAGACLKSSAKGLRLCRLMCGSAPRFRRLAQRIWGCAPKPGRSPKFNIELSGRPEAFRTSDGTAVPLNEFLAKAASRREYSTPCALKASNSSLQSEFTGWLLVPGEAQISQCPHRLDPFLGRSANPLVRRFGSSTANNSPTDSFTPRRFKTCLKS